jgi:non-specific serine/threonine protein kinase
MATPSGWRREGNLPTELTSFVGRTRLLASFRQRLQDSRLVTVTGIGGVGKSRTALRIAHQVRGKYKDGVWYADLARLQDPGMVHHAITSALGIADQSSRDEADTLAEWLGDRELLLILDTCEHLVEACAHLADQLLDRAPNLRIIATSRRSLNARHEYTLAVPPLTVPSEDPADNPYNNEAVELFSERASVVVPDFVLDEDNVVAVAELCRRLDGIPLAIELAAVRLRTLSVEQILALLADRFSLLAGASRTALPRHQTLRAAIGWSHELCEPAERLLWARLSVFSGDFELEAARSVCAGDNLAPATIADVLSGLVDKSVLLSFATAAGQRYRLIDTLRQYGGEWLDKLGETAALRRRHRDYYLQLAERSEKSWSGPRQVHWYTRMRQEHDNIRIAVDYCLTTPGEARIGLELLSSLWFLWVACGFAREGALYLERALKGCPTPSKERCKALWVLAYLRSAQGDLPGSLAAAEECSTDAVQVGDSVAVLLATKMQGTAAMLQGDAKKATALLGVAIEFHRGGRELNPGLLPAIVELSMVLLAQGDYMEAETLLADCLKVCQERGELWLRSYAWYVTSLVRRGTDRRDEALAACKEALRIKRHFHDVLGVVLCVDQLAGLSLDLGWPERTAFLLGAAQANWKTFGLPQFGSPFFTTEHEQCVKECKKAIGDAAYDDAYAEGARLSLSDLIEYALDDFDDFRAPVD